MGCCDIPDKRACRPLEFVLGRMVGKLPARADLRALLYSLFFPSASGSNHHLSFLYTPRLAMTKNIRVFDARRSRDMSVTSHDLTNLLECASIYDPTSQLSMHSESPEAFKLLTSLITIKSSIVYPRTS